MRDYNVARTGYVEQHLWGFSNTEADIPLEYKLIQNSPNPFSTSTLIRYQLPEAATVHLKIYNSSGQLIKSFSQQQYSGGQYAFEWDASNYSPGVYIVSMETDEYFAVKKLLKK